MVRTTIVGSALLASLVFASTAQTQGLEARVKQLEDKIAKAHVKCIKTENTSATANSPVMLPNRNLVPQGYALVSMGCRIKPDDVSQAPTILEFSSDQCYTKSSPGVSLTSIAVFCGVSFE